MSGSEFGDNEGTRMLVKKTLNGLKTSGSEFWELLAGSLRTMGFAPARYDENVRVKPREDRNDYMAARADGLSVVAKEISSCVIKIKEDFHHGPKCPRIRRI